MPSTQRSVDCSNVAVFPRRAPRMSRSPVRRTWPRSAPRSSSSGGFLPGNNAVGRRDRQAVATPGQQPGGREVIRVGAPEIYNFFRRAKDRSGPWPGRQSSNTQSETLTRHSARPGCPGCRSGRSIGASRLSIAVVLGAAYTIAFAVSSKRLPGILKRCDRVGHSRSFSKALRNGCAAYWLTGR